MSRLVYAARAFDVEFSSVQILAREKTATLIVVVVVVAVVAVVVYAFGPVVLHLARELSYSHFSGPLLSIAVFSF